MTFAPKDPMRLVDRLAKLENPTDQAAMRKVASVDFELKVFSIRFNEDSTNYIRQEKVPDFDIFSRGAYRLMKTVREKLISQSKGDIGTNSVKPLEVDFTSAELLSLMRDDKRREVVKVDLVEGALRCLLDLVTQDRQRMLSQLGRSEESTIGSIKEPMAQKGGVEREGVRELLSAVIQDRQRIRVLWDQKAGIGGNIGKMDIDDIAKRVANDRSDHSKIRRLMEAQLKNGGKAKRKLPKFKK